MDQTNLKQFNVKLLYFASQIIADLRELIKIAKFNGYKYA